MNIFEQATRRAIRFESAKGDLSVEQLWDLPLQSRNQFDLDTVAKTVNRQLNAVTEESFVSVRENPAKETLSLKLEIVKHIISVKLQEAEEARNRANKASEKEKLLRLLDEKQNVLLINNADCAYLKCTKTSIGENILYATRNYEFVQNAGKAIREKKKLSFDLALDRRIIETVFTYAGEESGFSAALIITMSDVTEGRNAVKVRREFFSNASHELKTPITSIKGSA